ncbi:hypothetical protein C8R43DRAFT_863192, partial [Mycena crocata]
KQKLSSFEANLLSAPEPLLLRILSFWSLQDIITCETLSSAFRNIVGFYRSVAWNADNFFRSWFLDSPSWFRAVLKSCNAVVSGSQLVQFFDRSTYFESDMDIFLRIGSVSRMGVWLECQGYILDCTSQGYHDVSHDVDALLTSKMTYGPLMQDNTVQSVHNYKRFVASPTVVYLQKIQLVIVDMNPVHHILFDFHSTGVMNYMTFNTVVSVFPVSTFIRRKSYTARSRRESENCTTTWKSKYMTRGFRLV